MFLIVTRIKVRRFLKVGELLIGSFAVSFVCANKKYFCACYMYNFLLKSFDVISC